MPPVLDVLATSLYENLAHPVAFHKNARVKENIAHLKRWALGSVTFRLSTTHGLWAKRVTLHNDNINSTKQDWSEVTFGLPWEYERWNVLLEATCYLGFWNLYDTSECIWDIFCFLHMRTSHIIKEKYQNQEKYLAEAICCLQICSQSAAVKKNCVFPSHENWKIGGYAGKTENVR